MAGAIVVLGVWPTGASPKIVSIVHHLGMYIRELGRQPGKTTQHGNGVMDYGGGEIISLVARREETPRHRVLHIAWRMALGFLFSNLWTWGSRDRVFCATAEQRGGSTLISHAGPRWWEYTTIHTMAFFEREYGKCNHQSICGVGSHTHKCQVKTEGSER